MSGEDSQTPTRFWLNASDKDDERTGMIVILQLFKSLNTCCKEKL